MSEKLVYSSLSDMMTSIKTQRGRFGKSTSEEIHVVAGSKVTASDINKLRTWISDLDSRVTNGNRSPGTHNSSYYKVTYWGPNKPDIPDVPANPEVVGGVVTKTMLNALNVTLSAVVNCHSNCHCNCHSNCHDDNGKGNSD